MVFCSKNCQKVNFEKYFHHFLAFTTKLLLAHRRLRTLRYLSSPKQMSEIFLESFNCIVLDKDILLFRDEKNIFISDDLS